MRSSILGKAKNMNTNTLKVNSEITERLRAFINSDLFMIRSDVAKSEYWKHFGDKLHTNISRNSVGISGESGFYIPEAPSALARATRKILRATKQPSRAVYWLKHRVASLLGVGLMSYEKAFDAIMSHAEVSVPIISPYKVDHRKLEQHPKVFFSTAVVKRHFQSWSGYQASAGIIMHYYYQNILRGFIEEGQPRTVLEIGAGNGNFPSVLYHDWAPLRVILIDLPETLAIAIPYLSSLFPQAKLVLPNEMQLSGLPNEFDFAFLTVDQLGIIADNSVDLAINCHSFQEMTHQQIDIYFKLVQRVVRNEGFFFTANRVEKIPCGADAFSAVQLDPPNRFAEYPWNPRNEVLAYEISRLSRLVQLDDISIRLERICK